MSRVKNLTTNSTKQQRQKRILEWLWPLDPWTVNFLCLMRNSAIRADTRDTLESWWIPRDTHKYLVTRAAVGHHITPQNPHSRFPFFPGWTHLSANKKGRRRNNVVTPSRDDSPVHHRVFFQGYIQHSFNNRGMTCPVSNSATVRSPSQTVTPSIFQWKVRKIEVRFALCQSLSMHPSSLQRTQAATNAHCSTL